MLLADDLAVARALTDQAKTLAEISFLTGSRDAGALFALAGETTSDHGEHTLDSK